MRGDERKTIILIGAGGHARACIDVIEQEGSLAIAGLIGLPEEVGTSILGYPVLGSDAHLPEILTRHSFGVITIGQIKTPEPRIRMFDELLRNGQCVQAIVSPRAYVSPYASVGPGTIILHGAIVNAGAIIGTNCIINSQSLVEHDVMIGDHCHIATGARINSGVRVGNGSFVGSGSVVRQQLVIGQYCVIGMGQSVRADCADGVHLPGRRRDA